MGTVRINGELELGQSIRIGWKVTASANPYTYLNTFPGPEDLPFDFNLPAGQYDIETSTICPNCSGNVYSDPEVRTVNVLT